MKALSILIGIAIALAGCASETATQSRAGQARGASAKQVDDPEDQPPFIGMTKAQALARYGKPNKQTVTDEGEQWTYLLNLGEFIGKHMIPFFVSTTPVKTGVLIFGRDGRVKKFNWDTSTE